MNHAKARVGLSGVLRKEVRYDRNITSSPKIAMVPIAVARCKLPLMTITL